LGRCVAAEDGPTSVSQRAPRNADLKVCASRESDAYEFSKDKPIELIDGGGGLLYLLDQVGVKAKIVFPPEEPS
jgi:hypothetical protein